jgi:hypothetical protein
VSWNVGSERERKDIGKKKQIIISEKKKERVIG